MATRSSSDQPSVWQRLSAITDRELVTEDFFSEEFDTIEKQLELQVLGSFVSWCTFWFFFQSVAMACCLSCMKVQACHMSGGSGSAGKHVKKHVKKILSVGPPCETSNMCSVSSMAASKGLSGSTCGLAWMHCIPHTVHARSLLPTEHAWFMPAGPGL